MGVATILLAVTASLLCLPAPTVAACYFPQEFQGEFVMQSTANIGGDIQYGPLNVTATSIPIWGNCHRRIGNKFILVLNYRQTSCIRCLRLKLRSANVLQVFTRNKEIISKCYMNETKAEEDCPSSEESLTDRSIVEILLFKTKDANGAYTTKEYCPIDGKYAVRYTNAMNNQCISSDSTMDSCPSGSTLNFRLRGCTSPFSNDLKFECLGSWRNPVKLNENFLVFTDNRQSKGPKYRCALYEQDAKSGEIQMALSSDSTCTTNLTSPISGFEMFTLNLREENPWPADADTKICTFPEWMSGNWEYVRVDEDTMVYKDHSSFKTYTIKCVGVQEEQDKYLVFSRTQCDEERYNCMRIAKRAENVFEFQLGTRASNANDVFELCSDDNFEIDAWITQGRVDLEDPGASGTCPISGEYVGIIPDSVVDLALCAKLWSDCRAPELMYYQVSNCQTKDVYEEREYRCLGHWRESDVLYTYTQRRDVAAGTYECFVGYIISNEEIYIKEAGQHCQRHINPLNYGMRLNKTNLFSCTNPYDISTVRPHMSPTTPLATPQRPTVITKATATVSRPYPPQHRPTAPTNNRKHTTKPWNFDSGVVEEKETNSAALYKTTMTYSIIVTITLFIQFYL